MKRQDSARSQQQLNLAPAPAPEEKQPERRRPRADVVIVRGKIRLYSPSGFFLVLGVLIAAFGIAMAILGYWPQTEPLLGSAEALAANGTQERRGQGSALLRLLERHLRSHRMKMLGPFTMGIGIFIFICANAVLHENRDRETKVIHMRDIYSTVIDIHTLRLREQQQQQLSGAFGGLLGEGELRQAGSSCATQLAAHTVAPFSGFKGSFRVDSSADEDEVTLAEVRSAGSLLPPLLPEQPGSVFGLHPQRSKAQDDRSPIRCETKSIVSSSISAFTLPVIKLNNCVIDEPSIDSITEDSEISRSRSRNLSMDSLPLPLPDPREPCRPPAALPRHSSLLDTPAAQSRSSMALGAGTGKLLSPGAARKQFGSNTSLHLLSSHSKSLDLDRGPSTLTVQAEQRKHPSWPRLDRSNSKGYMKLENKEDPMDRLLVPQAAAKKDFTNKEKLLMISRSHNNLSFEHDEFLSNNLKRGTSETRF